jgi:hypothetical protein
LLHRRGNWVSRVGLTLRGGQSTAKVVDIGRRSDALGGIEPTGGGFEILPIDRPVRRIQKSERESLAGAFGGVACGIALQRLLHEESRAVVAGLDQPPVVQALQGERDVWPCRVRRGSGGCLDLRRCLELG